MLGSAVAPPNLQNYKTSDFLCKYTNVSKAQTMGTLTLGFDLTS